MDQEYTETHDQMLKMVLRKFLHVLHNQKIRSVMVRRVITILVEFRLGGRGITVEVNIVCCMA